MYQKIVLFIVFITLVFVGCSSDSKSLVVKPSIVDFEDVQLGESRDIEITLENKYGKPITIKNLVINGSNDFTFKNSVSTPFEMQKGAILSVTITFTPIVDGSVEGMLVITHDASLKDKEVKLIGNGVAVAKIDINETTFDFRKKKIGLTFNHNFELENPGTANLEITGMSFSGTGASAYSITIGDAPVTILPSHKHTFTVTFAPTSLISYPATLSIEHNAVNEPTPITVSLTGTGVAVDPRITLSTGTLWDFGAVGTLFPSKQYCEIVNSGSDPLTLTSATLTKSTQFTIDTLADSNGSPITFPRVIAVGDYVLLYVIFQPTSKTQFNDTLVLVHDGNNEVSPLNVAVTGTGRDDIKKTFSMTKTIEDWVVPVNVYKIRITAMGAQGGGQAGGLGAKIQGDFDVTPGETLHIIVGETGYVTLQAPQYGAGGGGGSFVYRDASDPLPMLVAAGGGGQAEYGCKIPYKGGDGSGTMTTTTGGGTGTTIGGVNGNGGEGGQSIGNYSTGGGGCGWLTDGRNGLLIRNPEGKGGKCPRNGAKGGEFTHPTSSYCAGNAGDGGFGGGGGMSDNTGAGGGGGGFNGGGGGTNYISSCKWCSGGGGGSYNGGTNQVNVGGVNTTHGEVVISY